MAAASIADVSVADASVACIKTMPKNPPTKSASVSASSPTASLASMLSASFPHLTLHTSTSDPWVTIERGTFDVFVHDEPYTLQQLLLCLQNVDENLRGETLYFARIFGQTRTSGRVEDVEALKHLLHSFFDQTRVCTGLYHQTEQYGSDQLVPSENPFYRLNSVQCTTSFFDYEGDGGSVGLCGACSKVLCPIKSEQRVEDFMECGSVDLEKEENSTETNEQIDPIYEEPIQVNVKVEAKDECESEDDDVTWGRPSISKSKPGRPHGSKVRKKGKSGVSRRPKKYYKPDRESRQERSSVCGICNKKLATFSSMKKHMQRLHYYQRTRCPRCAFVAYFPHELTTHVEQEHREVDELECPLCSRPTTIASYIEHFKTCHAAKLRMEYERIIGDHVCDTCGKIFKTKNSLQTHIRTAHNRRKIFSCPDCDYSSPLKACLKKHMESKHAPTNEFGEPIRDQHMCDQCGKSFQTEENLKRHIRLVHLNIRKTYFCVECNITLVGRCKISSHMTKYHSEDPKYECPECQVRFGSLNLLKRHILTHGEAKFECEICGKKLKRASQLTDHMRIHSGERPYKCKYCSYDCISSNTLGLHYKFKHPEFYGPNIKKAKEVELKKPEESENPVVQDESQERDVLPVT